MAPFTQTVYCPTCGQPAADSHDEVKPGDADRVVVGVTAREVQDLLAGKAMPSLIVRMLRAMQLIDAERAERLARGYGFLLPTLPKPPH